MTRILAKIVVNAVAIWVAAWLIDPVRVVTGSGTVDKIVGYLLVGAIFGLVNAVIKPVVSMLSLPLRIVTLGLFTLVVNGLMLEIVHWVLGKVDLGVTFDPGPFFFSTILAAIVISLVSWGLSLVVDRDE